MSYRLGGRRSKESYRRKKRTKIPHPHIIIVCEGSETEPLYIGEFWNKKDIEREGKNAPAVFKKAKSLKRQAQKEGVSYDHVWCVFDKDELSDSQFQEIINKAKKSKIEVAYTNESFEFWLLLHFGYYDMALDRKTCIEKLTQHLGRDYEKSDQTTLKEIAKRWRSAAERADRILESRSGGIDNPDPKINPTTTVQTLIRELDQLRKI